MTAKMLHWIPHLVTWIGIVLLLYGSLSRNKKSAKVLSDGRVEFAPTRAWILGWILFAPLLVHILVESLKRNVATPLNLPSAGLRELVAFLVAILLARMLPGALIVGDDELEQVYWLWKNKHIQWGEIVEVNTGAKSGIVTVTSANNTRIIHSRELADRPRFLHELKQHCGENLPPDFPRETTIN